MKAKNSLIKKKIANVFQKKKCLCAAFRLCFFPEIEHPSLKKIKNKKWCHKGLLQVFFVKCVTNKQSGVGNGH